MPSKRSISSISKTRVAMSGGPLQEPVFNQGPDLLRDLVFAFGAVDDRAALRFAPGDIEESLTARLMQRQAVALEAVGLAARRRARKADLGRYVEDNGQVGAGITDRDTLERADKGCVDAAGRSLIDTG